MTREQHGLVSTNTYPYQPHFISRYPYFLFLDANHQSTLNPRTPTTLPVMYADEYGKTPLRHLIRINQSNPPDSGFHNGVRLWRGYFNGSATGAYLNIQGGYAL
jgi:beta-galactosidase